MDMGMMLQSLVPGMEHAEESDLGSKVSWIASDLQQRGGAGAEQQSIDQPLVLECERRQFTREREHRMDVAGGQQLAFALLEPADAGVALAASGSAGYGTSYRRWRYDRNWSTDRDGHREQLCGIA